MNSLANRNQIRWTMIAAVICGILSHGYILYNKISYHDDIFCLYTLGGTYGSGRWSLGVLGALIRRILGGTFSAPAANGLVSILFIALASVIIVLMFRITDICRMVIVAGIMETLPVVTSTFSYMFTAPYYMFALLLATIAAYLISRQKKWLDIFGIGAVACIAAAVGIYQAYFGLTVSLVLAYLIWNFDRIAVGQTEKEAAKNIFIRGIQSVVFMGLGMVAYALLNKLFLKLTHYEMSDYRGLDTMFEVTPEGLLKSAGSTYRAFISMFVRDYARLTSVWLIRICLILLWCAAIAVLIQMTATRLKGILCRVLLWGMAALLPLSFNLVNVMASGGDTEIHTLMLYSLVMMFLFPLVMIAKEEERAKALQSVVAVIGFAVIAVYICINNQAYMRVELLQNEASAFYNRMISRIEGTEGFSQTQEIYIAGALEARDKNLTEVPQYPAVRMIGYTMTTEEFINDYAWKEYVRWQLGFDPVYASGLPEHADLGSMNCYPDANSICIVDDVVVIKLGENKSQ